VYDEDGAGHSIVVTPWSMNLVIIDMPPVCNLISRPVATWDNYLLSTFSFIFDPNIRFFSSVWVDLQQQEGRSLCDASPQFGLGCCSLMRCESHACTGVLTLRFHHIGNHEIHMFILCACMNLGNVPHENMLDSACNSYFFLLQFIHFYER
jgi:hypothetical protein